MSMMNLIIFHPKMLVKVLLFVLAFILPDYISIASVARSNKLSQPIIVYRTTANEKPEEKQGNNHHQKIIYPTELKKSSSNEYNKSLTLTNKITTNDLPIDTKIHNYPVSMTNSHPYIDQNLYIKNHYSKGRRYHNEIDAENDKLPEFSLGHVNAIPKWNRYHYQDVMPVADDGEPDRTQVLNPNTDNNYESEYSENLKAGGDTVFGWFADPVAYPPTTPSRHVTGVRRHGPKMIVDLQKFGVLALIKIALIKLKALKALKVLLLLAIKLMVLALVGVILSGKFHALVQAAKLFLLLPIAWSWLANAIRSSNAIADGANVVATESVNSSTVVSGESSENSGFRHVTPPPVRDRLTGFLTATFVPKLTRLVNTVHTVSAQCVQTMACRAACSITPSLESVWINGVLSSLVDYIPNKKLKLYISTFKNITISRLENMLDRSLTDREWIKLCDEHYNCDDITRINDY